MVVVDSSVLIPLSRVGQLHLITALFEGVHLPEAVRDEVITAGKPGTSALETFLEGASIHPLPSDADHVSELEGITVADAAVVLLAADRSAILLANDKGLIEVARSQDVECWWLTTLLLEATKDGTLTATEASELLYDLVDTGMNLHPRVYSRVQREFENLGG